MMSPKSSELNSWQKKRQNSPLTFRHLKNPSEDDRLTPIDIPDPITPSRREWTADGKRWGQYFHIEPYYYCNTIFDSLPVGFIAARNTIENKYSLKFYAMLFPRGKNLQLEWLRNGYIEIDDIKNLTTNIRLARQKWRLVVLGTNYMYNIWHVENKPIKMFARM